MNKIYLVYTYDYEAYSPIKAFKRKSDAEDLSDKLQNIIDINNKADDYVRDLYIRPNCPKPIDNNYMYVSDSTVGGNLHIKQKKDYEDAVIAYKEKMSEYYCKCDEARKAFLEQNLSKEELTLKKLYSLYSGANVEEVEFDDGEQNEY